VIQSEHCYMIFPKYMFFVFRIMWIFVCEKMTLIHYLSAFTDIMTMMNEMIQKLSSLMKTEEHRTSLFLVWFHQQSVWHSLIRAGALEDPKYNQAITCTYNFHKKKGFIRTKVSKYEQVLVIRRSSSTSAFWKQESLENF